MTFLDAMDLAETETLGIAQLINARVASWWHVRGGGTLVGTPGLAEMLDLDTGTTKVTAASTIGCCTTGTT